MSDPNQVSPAPVPTSFNVVTATSEQGVNLVLLQVNTPAGVGVYFMEPGTAVHLGKMLRDEGKASISRLATPPSGLVVPGR